MRGVTVNEKMKTVRCWANGVSTYFTFKEYGSKAKAKRAAEAYRSSLVIRPVLEHKISPVNTSGHVGVSPIKNRHGEIVGWRASWCIDKVFDWKNFYFSEHGKRASKKMAIECRKKMIRKKKKMLAAH